MKKHFNTYGYLVLYLGFTYCLDRIYAIIRMVYSEEINLYVGYLILNIYWILFAIGSFNFLYISISKNIKDRVFLNLLASLGVYGAFYPIFSRLTFSINYPYEHFALAFIYGSQLGVFQVAFIFIGGLGVVGFLRIKKEEKEEV